MILMIILISVVLLLVIFTIWLLSRMHVGTGLEYIDKCCCPQCGHNFEYIAWCPKCEHRFKYVDKEKEDIHEN